MTENPYCEDVYDETSEAFIKTPYQVWNEGYNQAIEDALYVYRGSEVGNWYGHIAERLEALRKKVSE